MEKDVPKGGQPSDIVSYGLVAVMLVILLAVLGVAGMLAHAAAGVATDPLVPIQFQLVFWLMALILFTLIIWVTVNMMLIVTGIALNQVEKRAFRLYRLLILRSKPRFFRMTRTFYRRIHTKPAYS